MKKIYMAFIEGMSSDFTDARVFDGFEYAVDWLEGMLHRNELEQHSDDSFERELINDREGYELLGFRKDNDGVHAAVTTGYTYVRAFIREYTI